MLEAELNRPPGGELVALGTATESVSTQSKVITPHTTFRSKRVCGAHAGGIVTKGPMAVRDRDILSEFSQRARCTVYFSVPTVDEDAWRALEPGTSHPLQRLRAVRLLVDAGVRAGVLIAPIVPGITSQPAKLERTIKAVADHGAAFMGSVVLHLKDGTRTHFFEYLAHEFPSLVRSTNGCTGRRAYVPRAYAAEVRSVMQLIQTRYGLRRENRAVLKRPRPGTSSAARSRLVWENPP